MSDKFDFKKEYKDLYQPRKSPSIVDIPEMLFIMADGKGDPNTSPEYKTAVELLYGLSYSIKMSKMSGNTPEGYFDYVVPPLEGLWWGEGDYFDGTNIKDKSKFLWTMMIRQPEFVSTDIFESAKLSLKKKKPELDVSLARLERFTEGLCVQAMHIGSYDEEAETIAKMEAFALAEGYKNDMAGERRHHEIYIGDPRKTSAEKLKTVIRHPVC